MHPEIVALARTHDLSPAAAAAVDALVARWEPADRVEVEAALRAAPDDERGVRARGLAALAAGTGS